MSRFTDHDDDEERLPEHFKRIGYDADTQVYTFEDTSTGRTYESAPGSRYGILTPAGEPRDPGEIEAHNAQIRRGNKEAIRTMLPFALLAVVFLLLLFRFLSGGSSDERAELNCGPGAKVIHIQAGDTCWEVAKAHGLEVSGLLALEGNREVDCDKLQVGQRMCVPA